MSIFRTFSSAASRPFYTPPITGINNPNYWELVRTFPDGMNDGKTLWVSEDNSVVYEGGYKWTLTNGVYVNTLNTWVDVNGLTFDGKFSINLFTENFVIAPGGGSYDGIAEFLQLDQAGNWQVEQSFPFQARNTPQSGASRRNYFSSSSGGTAAVLMYLLNWLGNDAPVTTYFKKINGTWYILRSEGKDTLNNISLGSDVEITYSGDGDTLATSNGSFCAIYKYTGNFADPFVQTAYFIGSDTGGIVKMFLNANGTVLLIVRQKLISSTSSGATYQMRYSTYKLTSNTWQQFGNAITFNVFHLFGEYMFPNGQLLSEDGTKFVTVRSTNGSDRIVEVYKWNGTSWALLGSGITGNRIGSCIFFNESGGRLSISKDRTYTPVQQYVYVQ